MGSFAVLSLVLGLFGVPASKAAAVAGCDFNGDGYDDTAIGAPYEDVGTAHEAGSVTVLYGSSAKVTAAGSQVWHQDKNGIPDSAEKYDVFGTALACGDFDGDGFSDLAIGAPGEGVLIADGTGAVHVLYGSNDGLRSKKSDFLHRGVEGVAGDIYVSAGFGKALASGDFDGDGYDDLAVGVPGDTIGVYSEAGSVQIFRGGPNGLKKAGDKIFHRDKPGIKGAPASFGGFGDALASGDFDGDGRADLAIGSPGDIVSGLEYAGSVNVMYGSSGGLDKAGDDLFHRASSGVAGDPGFLDRFGWSLAAGDFDNDGFAELAIAVPFDDVGGVTDAGSVQVMPGSGDGLKKAGDVIWNRASPGIKGAPELEDRFGYSLTVGRFDKGARDDLIVGVPRDDAGGKTETGSVHVIYGSGSGLSGSGDEIWHRDKKGIMGVAVAEDWFGYAVGCGDFDGDGEDDVVVGIPQDDGDASDSGEVAILYGTADGLGPKGDQIWSQASPGVGGADESGDQLGRSVVG